MSQLWEIVGGADKGGILVRHGRQLSSPEAASRFATGALVEEIELVGERLHCRLRSGSGPSEGWISITLKGKELARRTTRNAEADSGSSKGIQDDGESKSVSQAEKWDPYKVLGIPHEATDAMIKSAYRKASLKVHPDRNPDPEAAAQFRELTRAKDFLLNPLKRMMHNLSRGIVTRRNYEKWWSTWDEILDEIEPDEEEERQGIPSDTLPAADSRVDVLVFGATGIVGTLACSLLQRTLSARTWSIAGRDERKLERIEKKFARGPFYRGKFCISGQEDIENAVKAARLVLDFSGPKFLMGHAVASACVRTGTHYIDTSGFGADVVASKEAFDEIGPMAKKTGASLIFFCGIGLIQADFGSWLLVKHLREKYELPTRCVDQYEVGHGVRLSGSILLTAKGPSDYEATLKNLGYFFLGGAPGDGLKPDDDEDKIDASEDQYAKMWRNITEIPELICVRCSSGLFQDLQPYGPRFRFKGWNLFPDKAAAQVNALRQGNRFLRRGYDKHISMQKIPGQGQGPCERFRKETAYTRIYVAEADVPPGQNAQKAYCVFQAGPGGDGDFLEGTAAIALEVADCVIAALDEGHKLRPGFGTPTYHLAHLGFAERLTARLGFKIADGPPASTLFQNAFMSVASLTA
mmetsp:Transcript_82309/g.156500  ORF Transcript_82309/g.156500 Transcript_82309/m.156500 type:complete len:637 (-) Transcript_82309:13-1923(-)